jgi:hypothetical protein
MEGIPQTVSVAYAGGAEEAQVNDPSDSAARAYRDALAEGLGAAAQWRRGKAEQYPDDERNLSSAEALERAAAEVESLDLDHYVLAAFVELDGTVGGFEPSFLYSLGQTGSRFGFDRLPGGTPIPYDLDALLLDILREQLELYGEAFSGERPSPELVEFAAVWGVELADEADEYDEFEEALGVYVGLATTSEAIKTLSDHTPGEWVIRLTDPDGRMLWYKHGWSWEIIEGEETVFMVSLREQGDGNPAVSVDAPLVLSFAKDMPLSSECNQYSGGLELKLDFGDYRDHTLTLVHGVLHPPESADVAPGLGAFAAEVRRFD